MHILSARQSLTATTFFPRVSQQLSMKSLLLLAALVLAATGILNAKDIVGDWRGTIAANGAQLRVVLHIKKSADGGLQATLDSVDQPGGNGIPVSSISLKEAKLSLGLAAIHATYEGAVAIGGDSISGTWTQGAALPLEFKRAVAPVQPAKPSDIDGAWLGSLDTGALKLRVLFHLLNTEDRLTATMDSPDQGMKGLPVASVTRDGAVLKIEAKTIGGVFEGKIAADRSAIEGTWKQGGAALPLVLKPVKDGAKLAEPKRPQNPAKPYPYREEEVAYENRAQSVTLAATLTLPSGKGPFPAALLITGSGPQDRDESLLGHRPFLVLADFLTRRGIAVLRADDRGVGKSTGVFTTATTADFATDAEAGIAYLKTRPEVDSRKLGLIGHSEGGLIAPMVAARNSDVAFIVMLAGTGVPGDEILVAQGEAIAVASGTSPETAAKDAAKQRVLLKLVEAEKDDATLKQKLKAEMTGEVPEEQMEAQIRQITSPWFRFFLTYDPAVSLRQVTCPVLAINGEKDTQVPPKQNLPAIRKALEQAGNRHFETEELPGLNHLFQSAKTGAPGEYAGIEETMSAVALTKVTDWILRTGATGGTR